MGATLIFMLLSLPSFFANPQSALALFPLISPQCGDVIDADAVQISWDAYEESGQQASLILGQTCFCVTDSPLPPSPGNRLVAYQLTSLSTDKS
jgi:hypothetical protein